MTESPPPPGATAMRDLNSEERNRKKTKTSLVKAARHSRKTSGGRDKGLGHHTLCEPRSPCADQMCNLGVVLG